MLIDASLFGHIENDSSLTGTYHLQGHPFARTVEYLSQYLDHLIHTKQPFPPEYSTLIDQMKYISSIEQKTSNMTQAALFDRDINQLADSIVEHIINMPKKGKTLLPGGWHNSDGGHSMVYEFTPDDTGFIFSAINAGAGIQYHAKKSATEKELYNPRKSWHIPTPTSAKEREELVHFIAKILKARLPLPAHSRKKPLNEKVLYEEILPSISYVNGVEIDASQGLSEHAYTGGQLSGTCSQRSPHQMLKINTQSLKAYQGFMFQFKQYALVDYVESCINKQVPYTPGVLDQIRLAIDNNLKILNSPDLFNEIEIEAEHDKIVALEQRLSATPFDAPVVKSLPHAEVFSLTIHSQANAAPQIQLDQQAHDALIPTMIELKDGTNLLDNLTRALSNINAINDPATQYNYLERLILEMPLGPKLPNNPDFYRELLSMNDFERFKDQLQQIQGLLLKLKTNWFNKEQNPAINLMLLSIISLQIDAYTVIPLNSNLPSFLPLSHCLMQSLIGNQDRNPFYATNNPVLDQRFKEMQERYKNATRQYTDDYHRYLKLLLESEPQLNNELMALYDQEFGQNTTELHDEIRRLGLKSLFLIARHYDNTKRLDAKFNPIITKVVNHMEHESTLRKAVNPFFKQEYLDRVWFRLSIDYNTFRVSSPLFPGFISSEKLVTGLTQSKYNLKDSPAKDALEADVSEFTAYSKRITSKTANSIQLNPEKPADDKESARQITQADIVARDYLHLRSDPELQIPLTLDYFTRHIDSLSDESNQRYVEANIFQPGLLLNASKKPQFIPQFDTYLKTGMRFFTQNGQHTRDSLQFLRLDFLVSRYLALDKNPTGMKRLQDIQHDLEKQLSLPNEPEVIYVLQHYLFLSLVARMDQGEQSDEIFTLAYKAYIYLNSHTNPLILEDKAHRLSVDCAIAQFKAIIRQQPRVALGQTITSALQEVEHVTENDLIIRGQFPVFYVENQLTRKSYEFNALQGKLFERGLARSGVPLVIQNHPLIKELGLEHVKECLMNSNQSYMILSEKGQEVHLYHNANQLTVRKKWTIQSIQGDYELQALTENHQALHANKNILPIRADLPKTLTDGTMNYWRDVNSLNHGILVQNNIPIYSVYNGKLRALDSKGNETKAQLSSDNPPLLKQFESSLFLLSHESQSGSYVSLPRYNLNFELKNSQIINKETGELVVDSPSPIHPGVAGLVLTSKDQQRYIVPVARFYATEEGAQKSEFYPVEHDIHGLIPEIRLQFHWKSNPPLQKPMWQYQNSGHYISFRIKDGEPIADNVADALYLVYVYMATNQTEKAWKTLEECNTRLGGLTGSPEELQFIHWICNEMPHILPSDKSEYEQNKPKRRTPPYVACQLKAMSLLCDYLTQNGPIKLKDTKLPEGTANALYESLRQDELTTFQNNLPQRIYHSFSRLQTMRRHLEHSYILSPLERKRLLSYYHQSQPKDHAPQGALGYEWMSLSLEELLKERDGILARQTADKSLSRADEDRLNFINENLARLKPVVAKSTVLELVPIDLELPASSSIKQNLLTQSTIALMEQWFHKLPGDDVSPHQQQVAVSALSSVMTDDDFIKHFPAFLQLACTIASKERKELYDFCSQTLIATRHTQLEHQESNIPLLCNILYRLLTTESHNTFKYKTYKFNELVLHLNRLKVPPLSVYQAKDVYQHILAKPEELLAHHERPDHPPLKVTRTALPSLIAQMGIEPLLFQQSAGSKEAINRVLAQYKELEEKANEAISLLSKGLKNDLEHTFAIEEQAGKILFALEHEKRLAARTLIQSPELTQKLLTAAKTAEPLLVQQIKQSWSEALALANQGPEDPKKRRIWSIEKKSRARAALTQSDLLSLYSRADFAYSVEKTGLSLENVQRLHDLIHQSLVHGIQLQSLEKVKTNLSKSLTTGNANIMAQALDILARTEIPGLDDPSIVILQHEDKILLRKRQVSALESLLKEPKEGRRFNETIEKIIMGGGKSKVILPILAEKKAQGDNLVVIEVPQALLATNHVDLNRTSQRLFGKRAYRFEFNRDSDCSPERFEQMYQLLIEVMTTRGYLVTTGESIQSLELKYVELLLSNAEHDETWKKQVYWCDKITNLFRNHADCLIDEVHQGLSIKKKLNYTLGESKPISPSLIKNAIALFSFIDQNIIREAPSYDDSHDWTPFKTELAVKLITDPSSPLSTFVAQAKTKYGAHVQAELIAYLTNSSPSMPEAVSTASKDDQATLAFFKQEINVRLQQTLTQKLGKNYGESHRKDLSPLEKTLAIPYAGVDTPNERNRYKEELEAINKTIQMMLLKGVSKEQLVERIEEWIALARQELLQLQIPADSDKIPSIDDTPTAQGFALLTSGLGIRLSQVDSKNDAQMTELHQRLQSNTSLIFDFLREYSLKQIKQDSAILSSDNFNHTDQYRSVQGVSGTPSLNGAAYHQRLDYDKSSSLGSDGYIFEVMRSKTSVSSCDYDHCAQFINDIISRSKARDRTRCIIDIKGTFTGVSNLEVAKEIARYIRTNPAQFSTPLKQVLYFNEDQVLCALNVNAPDKTIILGTTDNDELNRLLDSTPEERFTLYDQIHTTGIDIKQFAQAHALVLVDDKTTKQELLQGSMRERELDLDQTNELITPERMKELSLEQLDAKFKHNDTMAVVMDAPAAAEGQMRNHIRRKFLTLIQDIPSEQADKKAALMQHFRPLFEETQSLDLFALYGGINKKQAIGVILKQFKKQMKNLWESRLKSADMPPFAEDIKQMSRELQSIINKAIPFCLPEYDAIDNSFSTEVEVQKEVEKEVQIELLTLNEFYNAQLKEKPAQNWNYIYDLDSFFHNKEALEKVALSLNAVCARGNKHPDLFSDNLMASTNYAYNYRGQTECANAFIKPVFLIWYHQNYQGELTAMIVTPQEAQELTRKAFNDKKKSSWISTTMDTVVAGNRPDGMLQTERYQIIREQIRFFNGEFSGLLNQDSPLLWLKAHPEEKINFFENTLMPYRPGCEASLHQLKEALTQAKAEGYTYIADHPYEDLTQFNWIDILPNIIPAQEKEYRKLAEVFVYINQNWDKKLIRLEDLQIQFNLPMNSLIYVDKHLKHLMSLRSLLQRFEQYHSPIPFLSFINLLKAEEKEPIEQCLGMTLEQFYQLRHFEPPKSVELPIGKQLVEMTHMSIHLINILNTTPAFKGKMLFNQYFEECIQSAMNLDDLRPIIHSEFPTNQLIFNIINNRKYDESIILEILEARKDVTSFQAILIVKRCSTESVIDQILKQIKLDDDALIALLNIQSLTESQLHSILDRAQNEYTVSLVEGHPSCSEQLLDPILNHPLFNKSHMMLLIDNKQFTKEQLLLILKHPYAADEKVIQEVLKNQKQLDDELYNHILTNHLKTPKTLEYVYSSQSASLTIQKQVLQHHLLTPSGAEDIVQHNTLPEDQLLLLLKHPTAINETVILRILILKELSEPVLLTLIAKHCDNERIAIAIYSHPSANSTIREQLLSNKNLTASFFMMLFYNKSIPDNELIVILKHQSGHNFSVQSQALQRSQLKKEHFKELLIHCYNDRILEYVYNHPSADSEIFEQVLRHKLLSPETILNLLNDKSFTKNEILLILKHPDACNEDVMNSLLAKSQLDEEHLVAILSRCKSQQTIERVYTHRSANSQVRKGLLQHPLLTVPVLLDIIDNGQMTDDELMLIIKHPIINKNPVLYKELNRLSLTEQHFAELLKGTMTQPLMDFIYNHPSATESVQHSLLQHPALPARALLRNNIPDPQLLLLLNQRTTVTSEILQEIARMPAIGNEVLLKMIQHPLVNDRILGLIISHRSFDAEAALLILRNQLPLNLLLELATKVCDIKKHDAQWEQCFDEIVKQAKIHNASLNISAIIADNFSNISPSLALRLLHNLGKKALDHVSLEPIIRKADKQELDALINLDKNFFQNELMVLATMRLDTAQIDTFLAHPRMNSTVAEFLFNKPEYSGTIKAWNWLTQDQLLKTLNNTNDYDSLALALKHGALLSENTKNQWLEHKRDEHKESIKLNLMSNNIQGKFLCILEELRLKSLSHAIKATHNPKYEQPARVAFDLYHKLKGEVNTLLINPKDNAALFKKNCTDALEKAKPVLEKHRGYKQIVLDIINVLFAITALFRGGNWRLFEARTASMNTANKVLGSMDKLIEESAKNLIPPVQ
ncbi:DUF3638 domain-containing protein [Legionella bononiensis]|uniref:DUF3638 domain-containing protein n=1 Tax=Legionella bononiensis TaxID=2793102 RepID=A0ABS1W750_9GAMM|nr:DUF3638 domain-containing protein [Legionella bononiensis]MBL7481279.1 DUF3638 domain-containing protein [Legionella bononiensis]MBL7525184.1 DUF3638 domain-containing protein [Legionella bononiensis]MBL7561367.1 DUF3638 domain-containing protein [Legionella bononiensis]